MIPRTLRAVDLFAGVGGLDLPAREAGALQSFPADHPWSGRDIGQQIGNAVPPRLGAALLTAALGA